MYMFSAMSGTGTGIFLMKHLTCDKTTGKLCKIPRPFVLWQSELGEMQMNSSGKQESEFCACYRCANHADALVGVVAIISSNIRTLWMNFTYLYLQDAINKWEKSSIKQEKTTEFCS